MTKYAVVKNGTVINMIIADSKEDAELAVQETCVEYDDQLVSIGSTYDGVRFIDAQPYPSWTLNSDYKWEAPVSMPVGSPDEEPTVVYVWDEENTQWNASPL